MRLSIFLVAAAAGLAVPALAQQKTERYSLQRTDDGYVRMDTATGEMSICRERSGQLVCTLAADDRKALEEEVERIQRRVGELEERIAALEGVRINPDALLPSEEEVDKALGLMERFFRRFMDIVRDFEQEESDPAEPVPDVPQRT